MKDYILNGSEALGIELGSTRIKAVLIADDCTVLASDRKSTRLNSSHYQQSRMPSSA